MKDIDTWNKLVAEVMRLKQEIIELKADKIPCEMCKCTNFLLEKCVDLDWRDYCYGNVKICIEEERNYLCLTMSDIYKDVNGKLGEKSIEINFCPFCGRKL